MAFEEENASKWLYRCLDAGADGARFHAPEDDAAGVWPVIDLYDR